MHICAYSLTFAIIPQELLDVYPLSQTESALTPSQGTINAALKRIIEYLKATTYASCLIFVEEAWQAKVAHAVKAKFKRKMKIRIIEGNDVDDQVFSRALKALK